MLRHSHNHTFETISLTTIGTRVARLWTRTNLRGKLPSNHW
ncbi:hypothetical protein COLO4_20858 [Corchorus olitorius]|uniref:Uncharacterized protein n=1 Tax=Corchorus olitorius TaxID=93759 RepID=A0A1R3IWI4_9ROSI|nr:hypothetical protein COLO4_20856 [Corchorus olitorius]OMO86938.1 hypothetical protein COLO4_20858 [Corchorus olitorius]